MGKVLIIKGADFSQVAVEQINIDGKLFITDSNYYTDKNGYFTPNNNFVGDAGCKTIFWPIEAGQLVVFYGGNSECACGLCNAERTTSIERMDNLGVGGRIVMKAAQEGYVWFYKKIDNVEREMPNAFITSDINCVDLSIYKNNYALKGCLYINSSGAPISTASSSVKSYTLFYNVVKGSTITVTANSSKSTDISLYSNLNTFGSNSENYINGFNSGIVKQNVIPYNNNARTTIAVGETVTFEITQDCIMAIFSEDNNQDMFPASVNVSFE